MIPYPYASENHQRKNADAFVAAGAAVAMEDAEVDPDTLYWKLVDVMEDSRLAAMGAAARGQARPRALSAMVERILTGQVGRRVSA
jgi:UDP-N-acetylglucosamine--N-acetylmuramyl-(pentapeptide) pyrophosphoryl-undecaprenol N-acetylglucosamine transferase